MAIRMTWLPASVEKKHGHVLVNPVHDLYQMGMGGGRYGVKPVSILNSYEHPPVPTPYRFHTFNGSVCYVNGRREVYETNIVDLSRVIFEPLGREWNPTTRIWDPVLFRKLHKLEWLFG